MLIETTRLGMIEVKDESVLTMPEGMLGLEHCTSFVLLEDQPGSTLKWLQSVDDPNVAFIVINPLEFFPDYQVDLTDEQAESLDLIDPGEAVMLTTVTVAKEEGNVTTNLVGPIVINLRTLRARQILLQDERYGTKHVIGHRSSAETMTEAAKAA